MQNEDKILALAEKTNCKDWIAEEEDDCPGIWHVRNSENETYTYLDSGESASRYVAAVSPLKIKAMCTVIAAVRSMFSDCRDKDGEYDFRGTDLARLEHSLKQFDELKIGD